MNAENSISLRKKLVNILKENLLASTGHGFPKILQTKNYFLKAIWTMFTIMSVGLCSYMIVQSTIKYLKYDVNTKTRMINQFDAIFPTVTICNLNFFSSNFALNFTNQFQNESTYLNPFNNFNEYTLKAKAKQPVFYSKFKNFYGDSKDKLIAECFFETTPCNRSQIKYFFHPNYGNCYQFNSGFDNDNNVISLKRTYLTERLMSLRLVLNLSLPDELRLINPNIGGVIFIHNDTTYPTIVDPVTLPPNTETNIALSRTFYQLKEKPYSNCDLNTNDKNYFKSEAYYLVHNYTRAYSQTLCVHQCIQLFTIKKCSCFSADLPNFSDSIPCFTNEHFECLEKHFNTENIVKSCLESCPLECNGSWLDKTITINKFSAQKYEELVLNYNGTETLYLNKNAKIDELAIINIYYSNLGYIEMTESPTIELVDLMSNFGGVAGLFLGTSVLTLVEFIDLFIQCLLEIKNHKISLTKIQNIGIH